MDLSSDCSRTLGYLYCLWSCLGAAASSARAFVFAGLGIVYIVILIDRLYFFLDLSGSVYGLGSLPLLITLIMFCVVLDLLDSLRGLDLSLVFLERFAQVNLHRVWGAFLG